MRPFPRLIFGFHLLLLCIAAAHAAVTPSGELKKWHTVTFDFEGPQLSETDAVNPFLDYRLNVRFTQGDATVVVPGYFAADGNAAESGARAGKVWRVHFVPHSVGEWAFQAAFVRGKNIAVNEEPGEGLDFNGTRGRFTIEESDKPPSDFRRKGRLLVGPGNYLQFVDSGEAFLKAGAGSPENLLGYADFDDTYSLKKSQRDGEAFSTETKTYAPHAGDWQPGDPTWRNGRGKNLIGALNYLAAKGVNAVYFLTMNVYGDGQDVWPWINEHDRTRFDCSKLDQWAIVLRHMQGRGLLAHVITQETENELLLDLGNVGVERKLYYRELVARFGHQLALIWNLGEENGYAGFSPNAQNTEQRKAMSAYIKQIDPYDHPVVLHTHASKHDRDPILMAVLDDPHLDGPSFQIDKPEAVHAETLRWKALSREAGRNWILPLDEIGHYSVGALPDAVDPDHDTIRAQALWGNLMAGGSGVEWYFGYKQPHNDLTCEDWRTRDILWEQTVTAVRFFQTYLPFREMENANALTASDNDFVLAQPGEVYCVYLPRFENVELDLSAATGTFSVSWFNPKLGGKLVPGSVPEVRAGAVVKLGRPLGQPKGDWVALLRRR